MFKIEAVKLQAVLNYLQKKPFFQVVKIAEALVSVPKEGHLCLVNDDLKQVMFGYLQTQPLGEVYDLLKMLNEVGKEPVYEVPEGFDASKSIIPDSKLEC